jgi:hypothetical protein
MMASLTPKNSNSSHSGSQTADFTRPQEPQSPSNLNRTTKRQKDLNVNPPPRLELGGGARTCTTASKAISGQLEALEREARIQRTVMNDFAIAVDAFVTAHDRPEERKAAQDMCDKVVRFLTSSLFAETNIFVPLRIKSPPGSGTPSSGSAKSVSFADMAKTLKNSGADYRTPKSASTSSSGSRPTSISGGASLTSSRSNSANGGSRGNGNPKKEDRRLLISVQSVRSKSDKTVALLRP